MQLLRTAREVDCLHTCGHEGNLSAQRSLGELLNDITMRNRQGCARLYQYQRGANITRPNDVFSFLPLRLDHARHAQVSAPFAHGLQQFHGRRPFHIVSHEGEQHPVAILDRLHRGLNLSGCAVRRKRPGRLGDLLAPSNQALAIGDLSSGGNARVRALCQHPQKRLERISVVTEDVEEILDSQLKTAAGLARCYCSCAPYLG